MSIALPTHTHEFTLVIYTQGEKPSAAQLKDMETYLRELLEDMQGELTQQFEGPIKVMDTEVRLKGKP
jgi:hypothetical protein